MGQMRFSAPAPDQLPPGAVKHAYLAGMEGVPWKSDNRWDNGQLVLSRDVDESGCLYIPWYVPDRGHVVLSTCSLMERPRPYCLVTELARGTLHRARGLAAEIQAAGFHVEADTQACLQQAQHQFFAAITTPGGAADAAELAISAASRAIEQLCRELNSQWHDRHARVAGASPCLLAGRLDSSVPAKAAAFLQAFNGAVVPFRWRELQPLAERLQWEAVDAQVAWCRQHRLRVFGGPLIQLDRLSLPDWVQAGRDGYDALENHALRFVDRVVRRFENEVDVWICAGRLNLPGDLLCSEENKLRLAVAAVEVVRRASPRTPVVVSFDQPWAEYLASESGDLSPLHFADALVRADLGVAGIAVEMNLGYWPAGAQPRDLLEIVRTIDRWSLLGIPLIVLLTMPSDGAADELAQGPAAIVPRDAQHARTPALDQSLARDLIPLLFTRPRVHAVVWNQWSDMTPHEFPNSGLLDGQGAPRLLVDWLTQFRTRCLS